MPPRPGTNRPSRSSAILAGLIGAILVAAAGADDPPPGPSASRPEAAEGKGGGEGNDEAGKPPEKDGEEDGPLDPFFDLVDPAQLQRGLDKALGNLFEQRRPRRELPEVPELGEPVFFDLTRPLGARRYSNEINDLFNSSTATAPTLQVIEYEYAFADWNAVELDLQFYDQILEIITPFYQRTLGVGRGGGSVYGIQVSPDIYRRSGFIGGSAVYVYGWKPSRESRFSTLSFVGVNRQLIGGFLAPSSVGSRLGSGVAPGATGAALNSIYGAWRPTFNFNAFYKLTETVSLGIENDLFFQSDRRSSEYLSFPFVTWEAGQHSFFQVGGGYYHFEGRDQFTCLVHLNFVNPAVKESGRDVGGGEGSGGPTEGAEGKEDDSTGPGPIRRWLTRHRAGR